MKPFKANSFFTPLLIFTLILLISGCGDSSSSKTKTFSGIVCDAPVEGAVVMLVDYADGTAVTKETAEDDGTFVIADFAKSDIPETGYFETTGGIDIETGVRFKDFAFRTPLEMIDDPESIIISPLTTLMEENRGSDGTFDSETLDGVAAKLGLESHDDLLTRPDDSLDLQYKTLVLTLFSMNDLTFTEALNQLSDQLIAGTDVSIPSGMSLSEDAETEIEDYLEVMNSNRNSTREALTKAVCLLRLEKIVKSYINENDTAEKEKSDFDFTAEPVKTNLETLVARIYELANTLQEEEFASTVEYNKGSILIYDDLNVSAANFDPDQFLKKIIRLAAASSGASGLEIGFFTNENPTTGNSRIFTYNSVSGDISLAQNNVILGDYYFIYSGEIQTDNSVEYTAKEYGLFLDPDVTAETRTGDDNGDPYEYTYYPDNVFIAFDAGSPTDTWTLFSSDLFPATIHDQMTDGEAVLDPEYEIFNNITDYENSYMQLIAADNIADENRGEVSDDIKRMHVVIHAGTKYKTASTCVPGKCIAIVKDSEGQTTHVLVNYETAQVEDAEEATGAARKRLQLYSADLSSYTDVDGADGEFYKWGENDDYIYLTKVGSTTIYGFDKTNLTLTAVGGVTYPSEFTSFSNTQSGHSAGGRYNHYNMLLENNCVVANDGTTYLAINYDLGYADGGESTTYDNNGEQIPLTYKYTPIFKHAMIYKVDGLSGTKIFDNGDGVDDDFDTASAEESKGCVNLISASNDRLFVEFSSFDTDHDDFELYVSSRTGSVMARYASMLDYGYLAVDEMGTPLTELSHVLHESAPLRYMMYRVPPVTAGNDTDGYNIYITEYQETAYGATVTDNLVYIYSFDTASKVAETKGTLSISLDSENTNGCYSGSVILWSGEDNTIVNYTDSIVLSSDVDAIVENEGIEGPVESGDGEWIGNLPLCGIGGLVQLRLDVADTDMGSSILAAGVADEEGSMTFVYPVSDAMWDFQ